MLAEGTVTCPEVGEYIGFKALRDHKIAMLHIPEDAKRSSGCSRQCRASKVEVLDIIDVATNRHCLDGVSLRDRHFKYRVGRVAEAPDFERDSRRGIYHYLTQAEAILHGEATDNWKQDVR